MCGNVKGAERLMKDINKKKLQWDERSQFSIKGVKNLSMGDLGMIELYAEVYIKNGGHLFSDFMSPRGSVKEVLEKYDIVA